jgi:putative PIN family toxin of toxin-antitoxin system
LGKKREEKIGLVFDTNIWISLVLNKRHTKSFKPIIDNEKRYSIYMSNQVLSELARVLTYPRISKILEKSNVDPRSALSAVARRISLRSITEGTIDEIKSDPTDNRILECAIDSKASYIVSGDPHLLDLKELNGIKIVTAAQILSILTRSKKRASK